MEPLISIILPVYNTRKYLDKCIKSIINQTYSKFELIIVNDGSTDGSDLECLKYSKQDKRIKFFSQNNKGASSARNRGIDKSNGEYISFVVNKRNTKEWLTEKIFNNGDKQRLLNPVCKIYKTNIIKDNNIRFINEIVEYEDALFVMEYCQYVQVFSYIHKSMYKRNVRPGSLVNRNKPNIFSDMKTSLEEYDKIKKKYGISDRQDPFFVYDMLKIIAKRNLLLAENNNSIIKNNKMFYAFADNIIAKEKLDRLNIKEIAGKKNIIKAILIKYRLFWIWDLYARLKHFSKR